MGKVAARTLMFISSYFPLYIFLLIIQYKDYKNIFFEPLFSNFENIYKTLFIFSMILFILISLFSMFLLSKSHGSNKVKITKINRANDGVMNYIFTYIIPILSFSLNDFGISLVNFLLFILVGFLYVKLDLMYLNPLWALQGYIAYEDENLYIISDIPINDLKRKENNTLYGYYLTNGIFVAKEKDNQDAEIDDDIL